MSSGFTTILVVVYRFSIEVHLRVLPSHCTSFKVVIFLLIWFELYGFSRSLI